MALPDAALDRAARIGDREYRVRPPTVREAVECFTILDESAKDPADEILLLPVLGRWWSGEVLRAWHAAEPEERRTVLSHLLTAGVTFPEKREQTEALPSDPWAAALGAYLAAYPADPWIVWNRTPFPFFMSMLLGARRQLALATLRATQAAVVPHAGRAGRGILEALKADAKGNGKPPRPVTRPGETVTVEDVDAVDVAAAIIARAVR